MIIINNKLSFLRIFILAIALFFNCHLLVNGQQLKIDSLFSKAKELQYDYPDSAINSFQICLTYYKEAGDTGKIIETRMLLVDKYSGKGQYQLAYDNVWSLIPMVEKPGYARQKVEVFRSIAILYIIFQQFEKANYYLDRGIAGTEELDLPNNEKYFLLSELHSTKAWLVTESTGDLELAEQIRLKGIGYCENGGLSSNLQFHKMHLAQLYIQMGRVEEAKIILKEIKYQYSSVGPDPIHSLLYNYLGHLKLKENMLDSAILYFEKSVESMEIHQNHLDIQVRTLETLSECYEKKGKYNKALAYLKEAKELDNSLFGSRSSQNRMLFEIKDNYSIQLKNKEEEIRNQKILILERDKQLWVFRSILFIILACVIILLLIIRYRRILQNQKAKQELHRKKEELEHQKQVEVIEQKNKELMTSALKLIERDALLDEIKKFLSELDVSEKDKIAVKQVSRSITIDRSKKWQEFELYFNTVNDSFYEALKSEFSMLSSTDLKMCALIKLGFSSKDIAQLMSIGVEGINVSRSRIRKKLGLSRDVNLIEYLQNYTI